MTDAARTLLVEPLRFGGGVGTGVSTSVNYSRAMDTGAVLPSRSGGFWGCGPRHCEASREALHESYALSPWGELDVYFGERYAA